MIVVNITEKVMITVIIVDMGIYSLVSIMKGGKEDMTEKRFTIADYPTDIIDNQSGEKYPCSSYGTHMEIICDLLNELSEREEQLLSEIDDFQDLLSKNDNVCHDRVINLIDDKIAFLYGAKGDLINEDSYRLGQISFAIIVLRELKKELKGGVE